MIRKRTMASLRRSVGRRRGRHRSFVRCKTNHMMLSLILVTTSIFPVTVLLASAVKRTWRDIRLYHDDEWITSSYYPERIQGSVESFKPANDETGDESNADGRDGSGEIRDTINGTEHAHEGSMVGSIGKDYLDDAANGSGGMLNRPAGTHNNHDMKPAQSPTRGPAAVFINPTEPPTDDPLAAYSFPFESANQPVDPYRKPYPSYFNYNTGRGSSDDRNELDTGINGIDSSSSVAVQQRQVPQYGPGYPTGVYNRDQGFFVRYENNRWTEAATPDEFLEFRNPTYGGHGPWQSTLERHMMFSPESNQCSNGRQQSPIDVRTSGVACVEHHQIRTRRGDFRVSGKSIERQILPSKLRLQYQRRPCADYENVVCSEPDPPHADFPNGWGGFADLLWADFKFPAEHRIWGEEFDGEIQLYHLHPGRRRLPVISLLMKVTDENQFDIDQGHNEHLQAAINAFQDLYDDNKARCSDDSVSMKGDQRRRKLTQSASSQGVWDPYHEDLMPTYWFYGYDGSLTEPPCSEIVSWFVMDTPMTVSKRQLAQLKHILFTNVDPDNSCNPTSTHYMGSVARPLQETHGRQIWHCTRDDFLPDHERNNNG
mmetsp:Transcript_23446/g.55553  ORF Transcript_23446/g.55553 Transcript_23446/m.55553 type:complete len:599 (+) Transcript_23446:335-2131(+)